MPRAAGPAGNALANTTPAGTTYTPSGSLQVGASIAAMSPAGGSGIDSYSATGLPSRLGINAATGVIGGTPGTASDGTTVTASDSADNTAMVSIAFPAVARGAQTLSGFACSAALRTICAWERPTTWPCPCWLGATRPATPEAPPRRASIKDKGKGEKTRER